MSEDYKAIREAKADKIVDVVGDRIHQILRENTLGSGELADKTKLTNDIISRLELKKGERINVSHLALIADYLDTSVDWLIGRTGAFEYDGNLPQLQMMNKIDYEDVRKSVVENAKSDLYFILSTGENVPREFIDILDPIVAQSTFNKLVLYLAHPDDDEALAQVICKRKSSVSRRISSARVTIIARTIRNFVDKLYEYEKIDCLNLIYSRYSVSHIITASDLCDTENGQILVILTNFQEDFFNAPALHLFSNNPAHATLYTYYKNEIKRLLKPKKNTMSIENTIPIIEKIDVDQIKTQFPKGNHPS